MWTKTEAKTLICTCFTVAGMLAICAVAEILWGGTIWVSLVAVAFSTVGLWGGLRLLDDYIEDNED
jgi:hypothetical protein